MPLAIQLFANQLEDNPVWTPNDSPNDWLLAKIFLNSANGQVCVHRTSNFSKPIIFKASPG